MRKVVKIINRKRKETCFIMYFQSDTTSYYFWWAVEKKVVDSYKGTPEEFANDISNELEGYSVASFTTADEAEKNYYDEG